MTDSTDRGSSLARMTPAEAMATSVPAPIAMPTSAWARAGASLTPSPTIATLRPSACSCFDLVGLVLGADPGEVAVDAEFGGDGGGHGFGVAGDHHHLHLPGVQLGRRRPGTRAGPRRPASGRRPRGRRRRTCRMIAPSARHVVARPPVPPRRARRSRFGPPTCTRRPSTVARHPDRRGRGEVRWPAAAGGCGARRRSRWRGPAGARSRSRRLAARARTSSSE